MEEYISNLVCWNLAAQEYDEKSLISLDEVHYGPLVFGENDLQLLGDLRNCRVLDLGCGGGYNSIALSHLGANVIAVDNSISQLDIARKRAENTKGIEFVQADIRKLCFSESANFDLIISVFALDFIENLTNLFNQLRGYLKPSGRFIFSCKHPLAWQNIIDVEQNVRILNYFNRYEKYSEWQNHDQIKVVSKTYYRPLQDWFWCLAEAGWVVTRFLELQAVEKGESPYESHYYRQRESLLSRIPYTMVFEVQLNKDTEEYST